MARGRVFFPRECLQKDYAPGGPPHTRARLEIAQTDDGRRYQFFSNRLQYKYSVVLCAEFGYNHN
jgi:hypothetical protein